MKPIHKYFFYHNLIEKHSELFIMPTIKCSFISAILFSILQNNINNCLYN